MPRVVLTRLAVTYEALPEHELMTIVAAAKERDLPVVADDAGGARVGPAVLDQPRTLELGVDVGVTGLDKYGVAGPRLGVLAGRHELVDAIRARAIELGLEARPMLPAAVRSLERYRPERVRALVDATNELGDALERRIGSLLTRTPFTLKLRGEDMLAAADAGERIVPVEATAALAMQLLRDHGLLTVHFAAVPPGTAGSPCSSSCRRRRWPHSAARTPSRPISPRPWSARSTCFALVRRCASCSTAIDP